MGIDNRQNINNSIKCKNEKNPLLTAIIPKILKMSKNMLYIIATISIGTKYPVLIALDKIFPRISTAKIENPITLNTIPAIKF